MHHSSLFADNYWKINELLSGDAEPDDLLKSETKIRRCCVMIDAENNQLERLKNGDTKVFKEIFDQYFGLITYVVRRCGIDDEDSYDLVQDTFLKLYQKSHQIRDHNKIKSWLISTARHLALDQQRKNSVRRAYQEKQADQNSNADSLIPDSLIRELELTWAAQIIEQIQQETGDDTFTMFYRDGLSAKEIAKIKSLTISTVTNRLSRIRKRFSEKIQQHIEQLKAGIV